MAEKCYFHTGAEGYIVEPVMIGKTRVFCPEVTIKNYDSYGGRSEIRIDGVLRPEGENNPSSIDQSSRFWYEITRVIFSGPMTIVFWYDGTKTKVRLYQEKGKKKVINDKFTAITWAMAKKYYGSRSQLEKRLRACSSDSKTDSLLVYTMLATLFGDPKKLDTFVENALKLAEDYNEK